MSPDWSDEEMLEALRDDAERLATAASEQEERLAQLAAHIAGRSHTRLALCLDIAGSTALPARVALKTEPTVAITLLDAVHELSVRAHQQRRLADSLITRLGERTVPQPVDVVVVDDDRDNREVTAAMLTASGFRTRVADNGLSGVIAAHLVLPSVVLMDMSMPVLGGVEATRLLKASDVTRHIKVIAHTARPDLLDDRFAALFVEILKKPVRADIVLAAIARYVTRAAATP